MGMGILASAFPTHFFQDGLNTHRLSTLPRYTNPLNLLLHSCKFSFNLHSNCSETKLKFGRSSICTPYVVIDGSDRLNLSRDDSYDDEEEYDEDFAAAEYEKVEAFYDISEDGEDFAAGEYEEEEEDKEKEVIRIEDDGFESPRVRSGEVSKEKWERVEEFCAKVQEDKMYHITARKLAGINDFPLDNFQRLAIESFLKGFSVVVCAPTSSGKTLIAEAAALATVAKRKRLLYTTPLKALSNQKFREFRETFGEKNVGLLTGDAAVNRDAPILIMTTEILRNMLYQSVSAVSKGNGLVQVDVVVLDEVHYLSDISRGTVWEETVIYCPKEVQLICLSATISNPEELAGWIGQVHGPTDLVTSKTRPVPLLWHFSVKKTLLPLLNEKATTMNKKLSVASFLQKNARFLQKHTVSSYDYGTKRHRSKRREKGWYHSESPSREDISELSEEDIKNIRRSQVPQVRDTLMHLRTRDMLPVIWFIFSRKGCDEAVQYLEDIRLLDDYEELRVESALKKFQAQYPEAVREDSVKYLLQGVAAHHAGCLPLWKSFIEELFQQGLVKVVFATETLAAGINMPARTTVLSSVRKRGDNGHILLSSNALLQMAGRAGRRGIDMKGHVVIIQTPFEGAEECCKLLFAGPDPIVSQFSASYGMVLNLLVNKRFTPSGQLSNVSNVVHVGRTLEEARELIEQSFGNYVSSEVMIAAKEQLERMQKEIEKLEKEVSNQTLYEILKAKLPKKESENFLVMLEQLQDMRQERRKWRRQMQREKVAAFKPLLEKASEGQIHFICLQYNDEKKTEQFVPALLIGKIDSSSYIGLDSKMEEWHSSNDNIYEDSEVIIDAEDRSDNLNVLERQQVVASYYIALGSDNCWYLFTEKWIKAIYKSGLPDAPLVPGDSPPRVILKKRLEEVNTAWEKLGNSQYGDILRTQGAIVTWSWSLNVPLLNSLFDEEEMPTTQAFIESQRIYREHKKRVLNFEKRLRSTEWYREFQKLSEGNHLQKEKLEHLKAKSSRIKARISQIEPTGWRDFLQVAEVLQEAKSLDINTQLLYPLGETAINIRGANELWLAMAIRNKCLIGLNPSQLAAACGSLVSEGIKVRPTKSSNRYIYEASSTVSNVLEILEEQRTSLLQMQDKHNVKISCDLDMQFVGMVEAWASGLTWREIMMDCGMDDGDLARLLRRTIDLLAQIPLLPGVDHTVQTNAKLATKVMDRSPISELVG